MTKVSAIICGVLFALCPAVAHAQDGIVAWIDRLSGPGPFFGPVIEWRTFCTFASVSPDNSCFGDRNIKRTLVLRAGWLTSFDNKRFDDTPTDTRAVHMVLVDPIYVSRIHPTLDVGAGAGFLVLTGDGFDPVTRFVLTPLSVSFVPFGDTGKRWARVFQVRFEERIITKGLSGRENFNSVTGYSRGYEFLPSAGLVFNFGALKH